MKYSKCFQWIGMAAGILALSSTALAQLPEAGPPPPNGPMPMPFVQIMRNADTDKDQSLSLKEFQGAQEKIFKLMDKNSDGKIDRQEQEFARGGMRQRMRTMGGPGRPGGAPGEPGGFGGPGRPDRLGEMDGPGGPGKGMRMAGQGAMRGFREMDANGDGKVTMDELKAMEERFQKADTNGDGAVDLDEYRKIIREKIGDRLESRFATLDANKDGKLTKDEFKGGEERFNALDKDSDRNVTKEEMKAGMPPRPTGKKAN